MGNYIYRSFGKAIAESRQYMTQIQYFALAMSEYYAKRASDFSAILAGEMSEALAGNKRIGYTNEDGVGRYLDAEDLLQNLYEEDALIFDYDSPLGQEGQFVPASTILAEVIDSNIGATGFSRIFKKISEMKSTTMFNAAEMVADLKLYLGSDKFGGQISNLLKSIDGQYPDGCMSQLITNSPEPEQYDGFDLSDYTGDGVNIVWAACVSLVGDITAGITEVFKGIKKIKDLGLALAKGVTTLVNNLVNIAFADLLSDYEWDADATIPGMDMPLASYKWANLNAFTSWLETGYQRISDDSNPDLYTNCLDYKYFEHDWRAEPVMIDRSLGLYCFKPSLDTINEVLARMNQYLTKYGFFETIVYGIRIRILKIKGTGEIQVLLYPTGININNRSVVNAYSAHSSSYDTDNDVISMSSDFDSIGIDGKVTDDEMLSTVYKSNRSVNGFFQMPIFPNGYTNKTYDPIGDVYDNYSRFWGNVTSASSDMVARSIVTVNEPLDYNYDNNSSDVPSVVFNSSYYICQNAILFMLAYVFTGDIRQDLRGMTAVIYDVNEDSISYLSSFDPRDNGVIHPIDGNLQEFYPYYTTVTANSKIHVQTYEERVKEVRGAIIKILIAAAAIAATVGFFKVKKTIRTKVSQNSALLEQAKLLFDPNNPNSVRNLAKYERKARKLAKVANILGISSVGSAIANPISNDYSDDFDQINRILVG